MNAKERDKKIEETHDTVLEMRTDLKWLIPQVKNNTKRISRNTIILALIIGSGILSGGSWGLAHLLN